MRVVKSTAGAKGYISKSCDVIVVQRCGIHILISKTI
jgi:hypothetical protein